MSNTGKYPTFHENLAGASKQWENISDSVKLLLQVLTEEFRFSVSRGDLLLLDGGWYVTHTGLLALARRKHCVGISTHPVAELSSQQDNSWTFESVVYTTRTCKGFSGYGDASPATVPARMRGCEMRIAETRAVNRALRKAYAVGICSFEELVVPSEISRRPPVSATSVRDGLLAIIRQYSLDTHQVKAYAQLQLGTHNLREVSRERMQEFVVRLSEDARTDREQLVTKLAKLDVEVRSA